MRRQALKASVALVASLGVHFAAAMVATPSAPPALVEGDATAEIAALGSSFEDLLRGSDRLRPAQAEPVTPVAPARAEAARPVEQRPVEELAETRPAVVHRASSTPLKTLAVSAIPASAIVQATPAAAGDVALPTPVAEPAPIAEEKPTEVASLAPSHAAEVVKALPEMPQVPVPVARPSRAEDARNLAEAQKPKEKKPVRNQPANAARGNADRNARAGQAEGREEAKSGTGGGERGGNASAAGNAAASTYPGKVYSKIRRTRQKKGDGAGVARIRFAIAPNGALASAAVASSSGSASVDSVALDHIRRSAPFPPPPTGAQSQFVIPVEVRR
ncbi:MAG: TonB family protein [Oricola sp.]